LSYRITEVSSSATSWIQKNADGFDGPTSFGETDADVHAFTGSVNITGSSIDLLNVHGDGAGATYIKMGGTAADTQYRGLKFVNQAGSAKGYLTFKPSIPELMVWVGGGDADDVKMVITETTNEITGSTILTASTHPLKLVGVQSGSIAGPGSYLGLNASNQVVLTASSGGGGGGGTPGGSDTQIQFNDGGSFAGDANFVWQKTPNNLIMTGSARLRNVYVSDECGDFDSATSIGCWASSSKHPLVLAGFDSTIGFAHSTTPYSLGAMIHSRAKATHGVRNDLRFYTKGSGSIEDQFKARMMISNEGSVIIGSGFIDDVDARTADFSSGLDEGQNSHYTLDVSGSMRTLGAIYVGATVLTGNYSIPPLAANRHHKGPVYFVSASSAITITLPIPGTSNLQTEEITIKDVKGNAGTYNITINPYSGDTIQGQSSLSIQTNYGSVKLLSFRQGSTVDDWQIVSVN